MIGHDLEICIKRAIEEAQTRKHEYVIPEHLLYSLLQNKQIGKIIEACGGSVDFTRQCLIDFFATKVESLPYAENFDPKPSRGFQRVLEETAQGVLSSGKSTMTPERVLVSLFSEEESFAKYFIESQNIRKFDVINYLSHGVPKVDESYPDISFDRESDEQENSSGKLALPKEQPSQELLPDKFIKKYTTNLTEMAQKGSFDPLIGRTKELQRAIQILCRRRRNNPLFVGDSGVGKTAIVEGLAGMMSSQEVPPLLQSSDIFSLDLGALLAGTKYRGDFEVRMKGLLSDFEARPGSILFIDEIHTIIGAGSVSGGAMDASNLLKPFLSNGKLRCLGSTTFKEYRKFFENDYAMVRRFQKVVIEEPSKKEAIEIIKGLKTKYEEHHAVSYTGEAIRASVDLGSQYFKDRKLPDIAIDIIDEAGAFKALSKKTRTSSQKREVSIQDIKKVVSLISRVPLSKLTKSDKKLLKGLGSTLKKSIYGQDQAVDLIENMIRLSRSGLSQKNKPVGSFLFSGPTGVGKTEMARQLSKVLSIAIVRFDMSEYMEKHSVSRLIGAPPGYIGHESGGLLTDKINEEPHSILLLDEIEKAHPDIHNILLQVLDHGQLTDSNGRCTDFRNTIIIMTTNVGALDLAQQSIGFGDLRDNSQKEKKAIKQAFSPEFRNRIDGIVSFHSLSKEIVYKIIRKFLGELSEQLGSKGLKLDYGMNLVEHIMDQSYDPQMGARPIQRYIQDKIKRQLSSEILFGSLKKGTVIKIHCQNSQLSFSYT